MSGVLGHRCSVCTFTYPNTITVCALCGNDNLWNTYTLGPDDDWQEQLRWRLLSKSEKDEEERPKWDDLVPHNFDNTAELVGHNDRIWVTHDELLACDYRLITEDMIVFLNGEFYELQGYDRKRHSWWIDTVVIDASELTPELIIGYGQDDAPEEA